jgi:hypothetical protein
MARYSTGWDATGDGRTGGAAPQDPNGTIGADPQNAGRVRGTRPAYGGYTSTVKVGPDGKLYNDANASGLQDTIGADRGLAAAAAARNAYQIDYSGANDARAQAYGAREREADAAGLLGGAARGEAPSMTTGIGQSMTDAQLQGQLSASAGAKPHGIAAAAYGAQDTARQMGAQNAGGIAGMRAGELGAARGEYMSGLSGMRGQDYASQAMSQQQAIAQAQSEMAQRGRNARQSMGYEGMAFDANQAATNASMETDQADQGFYNSALGIDAAEKNRADMVMGSGVGAVGTGIAAAAAAFNRSGGSTASRGGSPGSPYGGGIDRNDPYANDGIDRNNPY